MASLCIKLNFVSLHPIELELISMLTSVIKLMKFECPMIKGYQRMDCPRISQLITANMETHMEIMEIVQEVVDHSVDLGRFFIYLLFLSASLAC